MLDNSSVSSKTICKLAWRKNRAKEKYLLFYKIKMIQSNYTVWHFKCIFIEMLITHLDKRGTLLIEMVCNWYNTKWAQYEFRLYSYVCIDKSMGQIECIYYTSIDSFYSNGKYYWMNYLISHLLIIWILMFYEEIQSAILR